MSTTTMSTVIGVFTERDSADRAIDDLRAAGFRPDEIGVVTRDSKGKTTTKTPTSKSTPTAEAHAGEGAMAGALAGVGVGGLVGLGVLAGVIPVIGPAIVAGTLGTILSNAAGGAAIAGLTGALIGWGVPEEHAKYYEGELTAGRIVVTVHADVRADEARQILRRHGAYDHEARRSM